MIRGGEEGGDGEKRSVICHCVVPADGKNEAEQMIRVVPADRNRGFSPASVSLSTHC